MPAPAATPPSYRAALRRPATRRSRDAKSGQGLVTPMSSTGPIPPADEARQKEFRRAWSKFATGVAVITTVEPGGAVHGMTANGVTSVSLSPPMALLCVGHERNTYRLIKSNGRFGINILSSGQQGVASHYAQPPEKRDPATRFDFEDLGKTPVLKGALASMDCKVVAAHESGDHTIFVAEVEHIKVGDGEPLLWYAGSFGDLHRREHGGAKPGAPGRPLSP